MTFAFPCVNVDLIYGIPGQTADTFLASVKEAAAFGVEEIFLYPLYIRHGARLERELAGRTQPGVRGSADGLWAEKGRGCAKRSAAGPGKCIFTVQRSCRIFAEGGIPAGFDAAFCADGSL